MTPSGTPAALPCQGLVARPGMTTAWITGFIVRPHCGRVPNAGHNILESGLHPIAAFAVEEKVRTGMGSPHDKSLSEKD